MQKLQIVGILNVTPDSYFDGGKFMNVDSALSQAEKLLSDGADILEVGGESTGPNSPDVSLENELDRTIPVIKEIIKRWPQSKVSIDTWKSEVAARALETGVSIVNDVTAGRGDVNMFKTVAASKAQMVLMYAKDSTARTIVAEKKYEDIVETVKSFLRERMESAIAAGIAKERIICDPGLGHFVSSDPRYSLEIIARLRELHELDCPLFLSPSRKSFLAGKENLPPSERLPATVAASAIAVLNGALFIRTHDVKEVRRGCEIAEEMKVQKRN